MRDITLPSAGPSRAAQAAAAAGLLAMLLLGFWWLSGCPTSYFEWKCHRVRDGMTLAEVEALLGPGTPGALPMRDAGRDEDEGAIAFRLGPPEHVYTWQRGGRRLTVRFRAGRALGMAFTPQLD